MRLLTRLFVLCLFLTGCASTEVNYNTLDIAGEYDNLITRQVVLNILKIYKNEFAIPSFARITAQSAQTTDAINPTITFPLSSTSTLTQSAALLLTGRTLATAGAGASLQLQANRQQGNTISPADDPDQLRRIRSIYQFVTGHMTEYDFEADYPIIATAAASGSPGATPTIVSGSFAGNPFKVTIGDKPAGKDPAFVYVRRQCAESVGDHCIKYIWPIIKPDLTFIRPPGCVMCDFGFQLKNIKPGTPANVIVLQKNPKLVGRPCKIDKSKYGFSCSNDLNDLFFYLPDGPRLNDAVAIKSSNFDQIYVKGRPGLQAFYELALFTQEAASQGTGSPASGGQSEGRKNEPLQNISIPVSGGTNTLQ